MQIVSFLGKTRLCTGKDECRWRTHLMAFWLHSRPLCTRSTSGHVLSASLSAGIKPTNAPIFTIIPEVSLLFTFRPWLPRISVRRVAGHQHVNASVNTTVLWNPSTASAIEGHDLLAPTSFWKNGLLSHQLRSGKHQVFRSNNFNTYDRKSLKNGRKMIGHTSSSLSEFGSNH